MMRLAAATFAAALVVAGPVHAESNLRVLRASADPIALAEMQANYRTTGVLRRPLITLHTLRDQQVPYVHETLYDLKTLASGSWLTRHLNLPVDRYEHCNFTKDEALFGFAVMLLYDAVLQEVSGVRPFLTVDQLATFERRARALGVPYRVDGHRLAFELVK